MHIGQPYNASHPLLSSVHSPSIRSRPMTSQVISYDLLSTYNLASEFLALSLLCFFYLGGLQIHRGTSLDGLRRSLEMYNTVILGEVHCFKLECAWLVWHIVVCSNVIFYCVVGSDGQ